MIRALVILLLFAATPAAAEMTGEQLYRLCLTDHARCAAFIKATLKDWPDEVLDESVLRYHKQFVPAACPPVYRPDMLAYNFSIRWNKIAARQQPKTAREAAVVVMTLIHPACSAAAKA